MGKKQKKTFKMADSKKQCFSKLLILNYFLWKFHGLVLGLVESIDAKGIYVAYMALRLSEISSKMAKKQKMHFLAVFEPNILKGSVERMMDQNMGVCLHGYIN